MPLGTKAIFHVAILVGDIETASKNWAALLGVKVPDIFSFKPFAEVPAYTDGKPGDYSDVRLCVFELDNINIELAQPGQNPGPWKEKFEKQGTGCLQHLSFMVPDRSKANASLREIGAPAPYHIGYWPTGTYSFVDTTAELGVELNIKTDESNTGKTERLRSDPELHKVDLV